jgi:carbonic anhydrase
MGHEGCGAIRAAAHAIAQDEPVAGSVQSIVDALRPAYDAANAAPARGQELLDRMVRENTRLTAQAIAARAAMAALIADGRLAVRAAHYALHSGTVTLLD